MPNLLPTVEKANRLLKEAWSLYGQKYVPPAVAAGAGALGASSLLSPDEAEASPPIRITSRMWQRLLEEAEPIAKELISPKGPVAFDVERKAWSRRLNPMFFKPIEDTDKFIKWAQPYLEIAKDRDPRSYRDALAWIRRGDEQKDSKAFEFALINLHNAITHEAPSSKAVEELMGKYPLSSVKEALLSYITSPNTRAQAESLFRRWGIYGAVGAAGLGAALTPDEAEAGPPKLSSLLKGLLKKGGPVEFDTFRNYWRNQLGTNIPFSEAKEKAFRKAVEPWVKKAGLSVQEIDKALNTNVSGSKRPPEAVYEMLLELLHERLTHRDEGFFRLHNIVSRTAGRKGPVISDKYKHPAFWDSVQTSYERLKEGLLSKVEGEEKARLKAYLDANSPSELDIRRKLNLGKTAFGIGALLAGGGAVAKSLLSPDEAEAGPLDKALKTLIERKIKPVPAATTLSWLTQKLGVTSKEIESYGLKEFLKGKPSASYKEMLDFVMKSPFKIEEKVFREIPASAFVGEAQLPRYPERTLPGGGDYKEILLALPEDFQQTLYWTHKQTNRGPRYPKIIINSKEAIEAMIKEQPHLYTSPKPILRPLYESGHWENVPNIVAHLRVKTRPLPSGGTTLFVEEFQSDWSREQRKLESLRASGRPVNETLTHKYHPVVDIWQDLLVRRALKEAVDGGHKSLSWTTGQMQLDRYDLADDAKWAYELYDKVLVDRFNKIGKKYGTQVKPITLTIIPNLRLGPKEIETIQQARKEYQELLRLRRRYIATGQTAEEDALYVKMEKLMHDFEVKLHDWGYFKGPQEFPEDVPEILISNKAFWEPQTYEVHNLPITKELKDAVNRIPFEAFGKLALAGLVTASLLSPNEAEAGPLDKALRTLVEKKIKPVPPSTVLSWLTQKLGVTSKEIETYGLKEFLQKKPSASYKEMLDFVVNHPFKLKETIYPRVDPQRRFIQEAEYSEYTLPGGANYKEILLQLPDEVTAPRYVFRRPGVPDFPHPTAWQNYAGYSTREEAEAALKSFTDRHGLVEGNVREIAGPAFVSAHWKNAPNVVAHLRVKTRPHPAGGSTLFVEEFQSDWAQKLRSFKSSTTELPDVKSHPVVDIWQDLVARRALKEAVDGGYKSLSWTTGKMQVERYDLSEDTKWAEELYDRAMVDRFNKIGRKYGTKVEPLDMQFGSVLQINPRDLKTLQRMVELFQSASKELQSIAEAGFRQSAVARERELMQLQVDIEDELPELLARQKAYAHYSQTELEDLADDILRAKKPRWLPQVYTVHNLPITKELRDAVNRTPFEAFGKLAIAGLVIAGLSSSQEAEAAPKPPTRLVKDILSKVGELSRADAKLKGMYLMDKKVAEVRKGKEPWRYIIFEDGTYSVMNKKYIASLASAEGEKDYTSMFDLLNKPHQEDMIRRSRALRQAKTTPPQVLGKGLETRARLLSELGEKAPKRWTFTIKGKTMTLPTSYGQFLKKYGEPGTVKLKGNTPVEKAINAIESNASKRELSSAEQYMLRRLKGKSIQEASEGLEKLNVGAIEKMVQKILGALR